MRIKNIEIIAARDIQEPAFLNSRSLNPANLKTKDYDLVLKKPDHLFVSKYQEYFIAYNPLAESRHVILLNDKAKGILDLCDGQKNLKEIFKILSAGGNDGLRKACKIFRKSFSLQDLSSIVDFLSRAEILESEVANPREPFSSLKTPIFLSVWLHLTNQCNFRCRYCYISKTKDEMSLETGKKSIDFFLRLAGKEGVSLLNLRFAGGEPLLRPALVLNLADYTIAAASGTGIAVNFDLLTNGSLLTPVIVGQLKKRKIKISVSLDGIRDFNDRQRVYANGRGTFNDIEKNLRLLIAENIEFSVMVAVSPQNIAGLPELTEYLLSKKIKLVFNFIRPNPVIGEDDLVSDFNRRDVFNFYLKYLDETFEVLRKNVSSYPLANNILFKTRVSGHRSVYGCAAGRGFWAVDWRGKIFPCHMLFDHPQSSRFCLGEDGPLKNLDARMEKIRSITGINPAIEDKKNCQSCLWRYVCRGICSVATYNACGRFNTSSPFCSIIKALIPRILELEAERLIKYGKSKD